jgi:hypothetical protein
MINLKDKEFRARMEKIRSALTIISNEINLLYNDWNDEK